MLAKLWKKFLLAVCIIACIFNIMSKLVNRHSLKENLESANDGITVFDIFKKDDVQVTETEMIIDGVLNKDTTKENTSSNITTSATENVITEENIVEENTEGQVVEEQKGKDNKTFTYSDFTIIF